MLIIRSKDAGFILRFQRALIALTILIAKTASGSTAITIIIINTNTLTLNVIIIVVKQKKRMLRFS